MLNSLNNYTTAACRPSNLVSYVSLHTGYSSSGASEVSGGGYARCAISFGLATGTPP